MPADTFTLFGPARWTPADKSRTFKLALTANGHRFDRRIPKRKRPGLEGAPLDDAGSDPIPSDLTAIFTNGHGVAGVPDPAYPQYHREFLDALEGPQGKGTSTLYVPGRGERRVRFEHLQTVQVPEKRDFEAVMLTFTEDKEDEHPSAGSFTLPSAKSAGPVLARKLLDDGHALGIGGDLFDAIGAFVARVTAAATSPFDSAADMQARVGELIGHIERCEKKLAGLPGPGLFSPLAPVDAAATAVGLSLLKDNARRLVSATFGEASVTQRAFPVTLSIFDVAAKLGQDPGKLVQLNVRRVPSLFAIPAGFPVLVEAA